MGKRAIPAARRAPAAHQPAEAAHDTGLERLVFFSDAVFAIAITLLALEIRLPAGVELGSDAELRAALLGIWPHYLSYFISFLVIGMYWLSHHRMFRSIVGYDRRLMLINLLLLMCIGFIPFPTGVIGEHTGQVATVFYALAMMATGLMTALLWWHASSPARHLLAQPLPARQLLWSRLRPLLAPLVFLLSIGISYANDDAARFSWILIAPLMLLARHE